MIIVEPPTRRLSLLGSTLILVSGLLKRSIHRLPLAGPATQAALQPITFALRSQRPGNFNLSRLTANLQPVPVDVRKSGSNLKVIHREDAHPGCLAEGVAPDRQRRALI